MDDGTYVPVLYVPDCMSNSIISEVALPFSGLSHNVSI